MTLRRVLTDQQIKLAKKLRKEGFSKKKLAEYFEVGATTIWENVYITRERVTEIRRSRVYVAKPLYRHIGLLVHLIGKMKKEGYNSMEVATLFEIPLQEINYIYSHF